MDDCCISNDLVVDEMMVAYRGRDGPDLKKIYRVMDHIFFKLVKSDFHNSKNSLNRIRHVFPCTLNLEINR